MFFMGLVVLAVVRDAVVILFREPGSANYELSLWFIRWVADNREGMLIRNMNVPPCGVSFIISHLMGCVLR